MAKKAAKKAKKKAAKKKSTPKNTLPQETINDLRPILDDPDTCMRISVTRTDGGFTVRPKGKKKSAKKTSES